LPSSSYKIWLICQTGDTISCEEPQQKKRNSTLGHVNLCSRNCNS